MGIVDKYSLIFGHFHDIWVPLKPPINTPIPLTPSFFCWRFFNSNQALLLLKNHILKSLECQFLHKYRFIDFIKPNLLIKLSDPLVSQICQFLISESSQGSRIQKSLTLKGGICGQIIFAK